MPWLGPEVWSAMQASRKAANSVGWAVEAASIPTVCDEVCTVSEAGEAIMKLYNRVV
jgi:hypothetical protein